MKTGVIAGYGELPVIAVENLISKGDDVFVIALSEEVTANFSGIEGVEVTKLSVTQLGKIIKTLVKNNIQRVLFAGKVNKTLLFSSLKFDLLTVKILATLKNRKDDTIMGAICSEMEKNGIEIMRQTEALDSLYLDEGVYSKRKPTDEQMEDVFFGYQAARDLGRADIGQTVVVKGKAVMALEAIEGTDKAVQRGCQLARKGGVVVKCAKPLQDERFDIPTVGVDTMRNIVDNNGKILAVEAGKTFVVNKEACIKFADENKIIFLAMKNES